ncbi:hypothetical protein DSO57_1015130 [Entomophthora muscae]|uniref:Uncharacterized protein n=1 Tax=Entomophthora muscae TaxID=34485 RepID=A0ACC2TFS8_9FUNG|nr:hypothetical protein DSO57_1015130 [Entomophthora muscae]
MQYLCLLILGVVHGLRILHTNDIHSHYDESNVDGMDCTKEQVETKACYGGLARLKSAIDASRLKEPDSLLLDAGDQFQGTQFYGHYLGNLTWEAMNLLRYDVMAVGNHEFDDGSDNLARVAQHFAFPLVSSNINASQHPQLKKLIHNLVELPKHQIAVVGYITEKTASIGTLGKLTLKDTLTSVQAAVDQAKSKGYSRIIALSHAGYKQDIELASKLNGLALIVGGHSHSYLAPKERATMNAPPSQGLYPTPVKDKAGKMVYVVQAYCWSRFLGQIDIKFGNDGYLTSITGAPIDLDSSVTKDVGVERLVKKWRAPFDAYSKKEIGIAKDEFDRQSCHKSECTLGNLITDAMLAYREAEIAILNSGDIRYHIPKGHVTVYNALTALPYNSEVVEISLTGKQIWLLLEGVVSRLSPINNAKVTSFIQVSHLHFTYNTSRPTHDKLISVQILKNNKYSPLSNTTRYSLLTTNFIANNGNNILPQITPPPQQLKSLSGVLIDYFKTNSPLTPQPLSRIFKLQ